MLIVISIEKGILQIGLEVQERSLRSSFGFK